MLSRDRCSSAAVSAPTARHRSLWCAHDLLDPAGRIDTPLAERSRGSLGALPRSHHPRRIRDDVRRHAACAESAAAMNAGAWVAVTLVGGAGAVARFQLDGAISVAR